MVKTYIFGHRKPDTDTVSSSIALSYLKNQLGMDTEPRVLGTINNETKFALNYFKVKEPIYLNDVKVQVEDIAYKKGIILNANASIEKAFKFMSDNQITALPLVNDNKKLCGLITLKEIAKELINGDISQLHTSYTNILESLAGEEVLKFDEEIKGNLLVAAYNSSSFVEKIELNTDNILICGDRYNIVKKALESKIKLLIVDGNYHLTEDMLFLAKENKVNVIYTPYDTYTTSTKIRISEYAKNININENPIVFNSLDYRSEILDVINKCGHTNYPIVDKKGHCLGLLKVTDTNSFEKQDVILVDHNQKSQSVEGIDEANILEIVDHHNLGTIGTTMPISFRSMPVGCTCTIIYNLYEENHITIPKEIAGLMLSAILSDTMIFKSPTTTQLDIDVANKLAKIADVDIDKYGYEMFKAGSSIKGMKPEEILSQDMKNYNVDDVALAISQITTMDYEEIEKDLSKYVELLNNLEKQGFKIAVLFITDVIKNGSYVVYNDSAKEIIADSFNISDIKQGIYLQDIVSRKKQMLPNIMEVIEKKI